MTVPKSYNDLDLRPSILQGLQRCARLVSAFSDREAKLAKLTENRHLFYNSASETEQNSGENPSQNPTMPA